MTKEEEFELVNDAIRRMQSMDDFGVGGFVAWDAAHKALWEKRRKLAGEMGELNKPKE